MLVGVVVAVVLAVDVGVLDALVVWLVVLVEVGVVDVVGDVVAVVVAVLVIVVVGVVTSQLRKLPSWNASVAKFSVVAVSSQLLLSKRNFPNAHSTVSCMFPGPGPLYSFRSALMAAAVWPHDIVSTTTPLDSSGSEDAWQVMLPEEALPIMSGPKTSACGHEPSTRFNMSTCAPQLILFRIASNWREPGSQ